MSDIKKWQCSAKKYDEKTQQVSEEPAADLTVGRLFVLRCEGERADLDSQKLNLELNQEQTYSLKLLRVQAPSPNSIDLVVTSYRVGDIKINPLFLTDGQNKVELEKVQLQVTSVLESPDASPYPPFMPLGVSWPVWVWIFLTLLALSFVTGLYIFTRRNRQFRNLREKLRSHPLAVSPYVQFNKELRALARLHTFVGGGASESATDVHTFLIQLDDKFRWFLARELLVPAFDFKPPEVRRFLRKQDRTLHKAIGRDLQVALLELEKAKVEKKVLNDQDGRQLLELCRKVADVIARARGG